MDLDQANEDSCGVTYGSDPRRRRDMRLDFDCFVMRSQDIL